MDLADVIGVLGFVIAVVALTWQIISQRVRLRIEIDEKRSEFTAAAKTPMVEPRNGFLTDPCTPISLVMSLANVSRRPNTIVRIDVVEPATLDVQQVAASVAYSGTLGGRATWRRMPEWRIPHFLPPGDRHEAWSYHVLANGVWDGDNPMAIKVRVVDAYGNAHYRRAKLKYRAPSKRPVAIIRSGHKTTSGRSGHKTTSGGA